MSIIKTMEIFEKLIEQTNTKREQKVYQGFITILTNLNNRDLTAAQIERVEDELKSLNLIANPENKRRYYSKKLTNFKQFLKNEFSLISEGYYTAIGMSLGMCFGVAIGTSIGNSGTSMGLAIGILTGLVIGRLKDQEAEKQHRVLKTKVSN